MAKPFSEDLRRRVVEAIEGGATIPEAAEQCGVSIGSVVRFLKLHRGHPRRRLGRTCRDEDRGGTHNGGALLAPAMR